MSDNAFLVLFFVGLSGGGHCFGMCGGLVGALAGSGSPRPSLLLAYNAGRLSSYALAGAIVGGIGAAGLSAGSGFGADLFLRVGLYGFASLMLCALGLYLLGATRALAFVERWGQGLWRRIQPATRRFLPARSAAQAFPLGLLWGWLPCGLVYSALATSLGSGSPAAGAGAMLAFGAGTLPNLLLAGLFAQRVGDWMTRRPVRVACGLLVAGFGVKGLIEAVALLAA